MFARQLALAVEGKVELIVRNQLIATACGDEGRATADRWREGPVRVVGEDQLLPIAGTSQHITVWLHGQRAVEIVGPALTERPHRRITRIVGSREAKRDTDAWE